MAKERLFDLPETKGAFQLKGITTGIEKDGFFKEIKTRSNKDMRMINFGIEYIEGSTLYVNMQGMEQENVYFSKKAEKKGNKPEIAKVPWADRFSYNREGFKLIGKNIGVRKKLDKNGKEVNDKKILTEFDACKEIAEHLKDGKSLFIRGKLDYSSMTDDKGNKKHFTKLIPDQVSLCSDINFQDEKFTQQNDFHQIIIFMGIDKEKDDNGKESGRYVVQAKIITYSTIEDVEFIIENQKLAQIFHKNLKSYTAIQVSGHMISSTQIEEVQDEDSWGEEDSMTKISAPTKREFIITGAKPSTIDKELYTKEKVEEAIIKINKANKAENDFGSDEKDTDAWGDNATETDDDDEAW
jgi:single-stranded DNA-binding protein